MLATRRHRAPEEWASRVERDGHAAVEEEVLSEADRAREALLMGLRLAEGVDPARIAARSGLPFEQTIDPAMLAALLDEDYLAWTPEGRLRATAEGIVRLDALLPVAVAVAPVPAPWRGAPRATAGGGGCGRHRPPLGQGWGRERPPTASCSACWRWPGLPAADDGIRSGRAGRGQVDGIDRGACSPGRGYRRRRLGAGASAATLAIAFWRSSRARSSAR